MLNDLINEIKSISISKLTKQLKNAGVKFIRKGNQDMKLAGTTHSVEYKNGRVIDIKYPLNCSRTKENLEGEHCWVLVMAHEEDKVEKFSKVGWCPC